MEMNKYMTRVAGAATLAVAAGLAGSVAAATDAAGWYVGVNGGLTKATIDEQRITSSLLLSGFTTTSYSSDENDRGYKLYGGYQFNRNFAIEGGYFNLGSFSFRADTLPPGALSGRIKLHGFNLDVVAILPISNEFSLFGRVGANFAESRDRFVGTGAVNVLNPSPSEDDTNYKFGFGAQWAFNERVGVRFEAERYRVNDAVGNKGDVDLFSLGLLVRF